MNIILCQINGVRCLWRLCLFPIKSLDEAHVWQPLLGRNKAGDFCCTSAFLKQFTWRDNNILYFSWRQLSSCFLSKLSVGTVSFISETSLHNPSSSKPDYGIHFLGNVIMLYARSPSNHSSDRGENGNPCHFYNHLCYQLSFFIS